MLLAKYSSSFPRARAQRASTTYRNKGKIMKIRNLSVAFALAGLASGATLAAPVASFQFDPTGGGGGMSTYTILDQLPGNVLAVNGGPTSLVQGATVTNLYQANLGTVNGPTPFANGTGGNFFTFVGVFNEEVTNVFSAPNSITALFGLGGSGGGSFKMCAQGALGNDQAGTGFSCAGDGILSGVLTALTANTTVTSVANYVPTSVGLLDGFGADGLSGTETVASNGSANLTIRLDYIDAMYFPDLNVGSLLEFALTNTSFISPFAQVDPSVAFSSDGVADGGTPNNVGAVNGISGPNFQFQADANTSFIRTVPEPSILALLGLSFVGLGLTRRRKMA